MKFFSKVPAFAYFLFCVLILLAIGIYYNHPEQKRVSNESEKIQFQITEPIITVDRTIEGAAVTKHFGLFTVLESIDIHSFNYSSRENFNMTIKAAGMKLDSHSYAHACSLNRMNITTHLADQELDLENHVWNIWISKQARNKFTHSDVQQCVDALIRFVAHDVQKNADKVAFAKELEESWQSHISKNQHKSNLH
ncbi:hypothetical protein [Neptuniibacter sp. QD37_11]|uniref:hypothetical protein n=1 Tax=Neptuniibacter sp. QD37_11 TaxID=3398209 RepID=UPI0039F45F5B